MNNQVGYTPQRKIIDFWKLNNDESINRNRNRYNANNKALCVFEAFLFNVRNTTVEFILAICLLGTYLSDF
jgi:hypothetical protein